MRFTKHQYEQAIESLKLGMDQLEPNGRDCSICSDSGHMAFECGMNPLVAVVMCQNIAQNSSKLHDDLHLLSGYEQSFGVQLGPARIIVPDEEPDVEGER